MRVAVTVEQFWHRVPGGTAVATHSLLDHLRVEPDLELIGLAAWHRRPPSGPFAPCIPVRRVPLFQPVMYDIWARARWPRVEWTVLRPAVVHATTILVPPTRKPLVVTLHDLAFLHDPAMFTSRGVGLFRKGLDVVRRQADLVLCSSLATMGDALDAGIGADRLRHVPLGVDPVRTVTTADIASVRGRYGLTRPYLLFVGTQEPRKNLAGLLSALAMMDDSHDLAVVGPLGWGDDVVIPASVRDRVRAIGFLSADDLAAMYAGAAVFVYPSLREGFGLPVAEAMAHGTPVVTSRGTSTEEVAGGAAVLIDPSSPADIARGITEALAHAVRLREAGRRRAADLTWAKTAALTMQAYRDVVA